MRSHRVEECLEALHRLGRKGKRVSLTALAGHLAVKPPSILEMIRRMEESGLVERRTPRDLLLTGEGERLALEVVRKHRLSERFIVDTLGMDWRKAHDEACRLEHALSTELCDALDHFLSFPRTCPHGHSIPDRKGRTPQDEDTLLTSLAEHGTVTVSRVEEDSQSTLEYFQRVGILPGKKLAVREIAPGGGAFLVHVDGNALPLSREMADSIWILPVAGGAS